MDRTRQDGGPGSGPARGSAKTFKDEAERLFSEEIFSRWKSSLNVWRNAWAMDTILDFFAVCSDRVPQHFGEAAVNALDPTKAGNWWDDFGWIGIASLRAAEEGVSPDHRADFVKIAINAWAYLHGPGWSKTDTSIYPFTDVPGWKEFELGHKSNIGGPNVWREIGHTWPESTEAQRMELKPRYSPGGAWNTPITNDHHPKPVTDYNGSDNYLYPVQNTVTNGLYTILSLRIYLVSQQKDFREVFGKSGLDADACLQAWKDQIGWLDKWMVETASAGESLLLGPGKGSLVRERVSTFNEFNGQRYWDAAYRKDLVWTGDQGLLLGALREGHVAGLLDPKPKVLGLYPGIIEGVFENGYEHRSYGKVSGSFLLPWLVIGFDDPFKAPSPGGDDGDYQTGTGVFMRYLLQAYKADPALVKDTYRESILDSAGCIASSNFGTGNPSGNCDAFTPLEGGVNEMTAYVNRLSVLVAAIAMSDDIIRQHRLQLIVPE